MLAWHLHPSALPVLGECNPNKYTDAHLRGSRLNGIVLWAALAVFANAYNVAIIAVNVFDLLPACVLNELSKVFPWPTYLCRTIWFRYKGRVSPFYPCQRYQLSNAS
jgi:hypothetical protein